MRSLVGNASHQGLDCTGEQHIASSGATLTPDRRPAFVLEIVGRRLVALRHGSPQSGPPCINRKAGATVRQNPAP